MVAAVDETIPEGDPNDLLKGSSGHTGAGMLSFTASKIHKR